jgi:CheY-like chemotaxis protein
MAIRPSAISVLVIEDSSFHRKMAVETLRGVGIGQIEALASAAEALKAAPGLKPDLILSDWIMPDIDGMALVRLIRRGETAFVRHVPVILMTAQATEETVEKARLAGVDEFVGKPFSIGAITTRIEAVLTRKRRFVDGANYAGPCRRRRDEDEYEGPLRRLMDDDPVSAIATDDEARARLKAMLSQGNALAREAGPENRGALRSLLSLAAEIGALVASLRDPLLAAAAQSLTGYIEAVGASAAYSPDVVAAHVAAMEQLVSAAGINEELRIEVLRALNELVAKRLAAATG